MIGGFYGYGKGALAIVSLYKNESQFFVQIKLH